MQDRFRFRLFDTRNQEMIYDVQQSQFNYHKNAYDLPLLEGAMLNEPHIIKLMQCTGLKDKSDRLIFEGDIIYKKGTKNHRGEKMYSEVVWDQMYAEFNISDDNGMHRMPSNSNNIEIIGNIYENPELLQGDNNV